MISIHDFTQYNKHWIYGIPIVFVKILIHKSICRIFYP